MGTKLNQSRAGSWTTPALVWAFVLAFALGASVLGACEDNPQDMDPFGDAADAGVDAGKDAAIDASTTKDAAIADSAVDAASDAASDDAGDDDAGK